MAGKPGYSARDGLRFYVIRSGVDGTFPGGRRCEFYDHYRDCGTDRRVWCDKDDREHFRKKQA